MKASIIGPTGYTGRELVKILLKHPDIEDLYLFGRRQIYFHEEYPEFIGVFEKEIEKIDAKKIVDVSDIIFIALPHKISMEVTPMLRLQKNDVRIIDLSADYRLENSESYFKAYETEHKDPSFQGKYTYGLCEAKRNDIKKSRLIANPGCYPTSILLPLLPLLEKDCIEGTIIADSKSGASGAGKKLNHMLHFVENNENIVPYKIFKHQHTPEMMQFISSYGGSRDLIFTPHLLPVERGILSVLYIKIKESFKNEDIRNLFEKRFKSEIFVRVLGENDVPSLSRVKNTNFCDIGVFIDPEKEYIVIISAIDNLVKGAAGQAVQNMNIMFGINESKGLK
ncbi:MAG: N-acetyl-gamma-glutamyl-phosphate reductase [Candidatus Aureabacteria bacterium]|nr:N-acetyl-gamma-glutamyl-phosphate reductase [Candidatus Auribacterota bacterium]